MIAVVALTAGGAALWLSLRQDEVYEATAAISFADESRQANAIAGSAGRAVPAEQTAQARAETIDQPALAERAQRSLGTQRSPEDLQGAVQASVDPDALLVTVAASSEDPVFAAEVANEFAEQAERAANREGRKEMGSALEAVEGRLQELGASTDPTREAERAALADHLSRLRVLSNADAAQVVRRAQVPEEPVSPRPVRDVAIGLALGLLIGMVIALLRSSLDRRLHGPTEVQRQVDLPLLGHVPTAAMGRVVRPGADDWFRSELEAFRILRHNLEFLSGDAPPRVLLVTSPAAQEGKSTVAASLACAWAASGARTILVECDLRRPCLASRLGVTPAPGLTDFVSGLATPREILRTLELSPSPTSSGNGSGAAAAWEASGKARRLAYITAGTATPQPAQVLQSVRFHEVLRKVRKAFDCVILDASPLLPVADALEIVPSVDAVVLCVRSARTTREHALAAKAALDHLPRRAAGVVVTGVKRREADSYGYRPAAAATSLS